MNEQEFTTQAAKNISTYLFQELKIRPGVDYRARVPAYAPRAIALEMAINPSYIKRLAGMTNELSMAIGLSGEYTVRIRRGLAGRLIVEIPKPRELWRQVKVSALRRRQGIIAPLGLDMGNHQTVLDLSDPLTPHVLIAGGTGAGKSNAGRLVVFDLANQNTADELSLVLIDTKKHGKAWADFGRLPHLLHGIITQEDEALKALAWGMAELDKRAKERRDRPRIFFAIDEAQSLLTQSQFVKPISELAAIGREWGIHLGLLIQNPTADNMGTADIKRNIQSRLVGKVDSGTAANVATGIGETGAQSLTGAGDMVLIANGDIKRLTTALVTTQDISRLDTVETVRTLELGEYEDIGHVIEQSNLPGRNPDPLEPAHITRVMIEPEISQRQLNRDFGIGFNKAKTVISFAHAILAALDASGYGLCLKDGCNEIGATKLSATN